MRTIAEDVLYSLILGLGFASGIMGAILTQSYFNNMDETPYYLLMMGIGLILLGLSIVGGMASEIFEG